MAWPTDDEIEARAESIVRPGDQLPFPDWLTTACRDANESAQGFVRATLGPLGYSLAQLDVWAATKYGRSLLIDIALFFVAVKARLDIRPAEDQNSAPAVLDRRAELQAQLVLVGDDGVIIVPAGAADGQSVVLHGRVKDVPEDVGRQFFDRDRRRWKPW